MTDFTASDARQQASARQIGQNAQGGQMTTNQPKAPVTDIKAIAAEIGVMYNELGQKFMSVTKAPYQRISDLLAFIAQGLATPTEAAEALIRDTHAAFTHFAQAAALLAPKAEAGNVGGNGTNPATRPAA